MLAVRGDVPCPGTLHPQPSSVADSESTTPSLVPAGGAGSPVPTGAPSEPIGAVGAGDVALVPGDTGGVFPVASVASGLPAFVSSLVSGSGPPAVVSAVVIALVSSLVAAAVVSALSSLVGSVESVVSVSVVSTTGGSG